MDDNRHININGIRESHAIFCRCDLKFCFPVRQRKRTRLARFSQTFQKARRLHKYFRQNFPRDIGPPLQNTYKFFFTTAPFPIVVLLRRKNVEGQNSVSIRTRVCFLVILVFSKTSVIITIIFFDKQYSLI